MNEIDKKIKKYYESKSLSNDQLKKIVDNQKGLKNKPSKLPWKYAAIFCFFAISFVLYQYKSIPQERLLDKYAKEVAFNHHKNLASDILTQSVSNLNKKMSKLNFEIHIPQEINNKYSLLGGRYCSIDERLAAQLKLQNKENNQIVTLYVLDEIKNENFNESFYVDSTSIHIWNEESKLFVLASDPIK